MRPRIARALGALLLAVGVLLTAANGATAAAASTASAARAEAAPTLEPPTLTSATFIQDPFRGDYVLLLWNPSPSDDVVEYAKYANGKFLFRGPVFENPFFGHLAEIDLEQRGLTGNETFTVTAIDSKGRESVQSNGLTAVPQKVLPAPTLTSAVIKGDKLTLTWTPSHTDEVSGNIFYHFFAEPGGIFGGAVNATTATTGLSFSDPNDSTVPPSTSRRTRRSASGPWTARGRRPRAVTN